MGPGKERLVIVSILPVYGVLLFIGIGIYVHTLITSLPAAEPGPAVHLIGIERREEPMMAG